jgi:argininosuccinate lyase
VRLPEAYCSGSSIMPQKMNPDIPELVRAKTGRVFGDLMALLTVLKGLPLAYNKDLQETQEPLYDAVETALACTRTMAGLLKDTRFDTERLRRALSEGHLLATEIADHLASRGLPFRQAHAAAGAMVRRASERKVDLLSLSLDEMREASGVTTIDESVRDVLDDARAVDRRDVVGGPARRRILEEIERVTPLIAQED